MPMRKDYSLFPHIPESKGGDIRREWPKKKGEDYFDWFLGIVDARIDNLLGYFRETITFDSIADLKRIGNKVAAQLLSDECWCEGGETTIQFRSGHTAVVDRGKVLTTIGYSLAADMGCLLAHLLLRDFGEKITWELVTKPKNDMYYLHPVLVGFALPLEPVEVSIVCALKVLDDTESGDIWAQMYQRLTDTMKKKDTGP